MEANQITSVALAVMLLAAGMYDLVAAIRFGYPGTLSSVIRDYSHQYPLIPFLAGALIAHLFGF